MCLQYSYLTDVYMYSNTWMTLLLHSGCHKNVKHSMYAIALENWSKQLHFRFWKVRSHLSYAHLDRMEMLLFSKFTHSL